MAPPRYKKAPKGPSKLRLRMRANKANRLAQRSTDRKVHGSLEDNSITKPGNIDVKSAEEAGNNAAMQKMVDKTNNGNSLMQNFTHSKLTSDDTIKPQLKVEEDVKLDTSKSPGYKEYINAQKMKGKVDPKDITDIAMEGKPTISKLEPSMEAHTLARKNISDAYKKHDKDYKPDLVSWKNALGGHTERHRDPKTGEMKIVNTSIDSSGNLVTSDPQDMMTYMRNPDNKGALQAYAKARHENMKKHFYESDAYNIWDTKTKGSGMSYRAGGGDDSFSYSQDYQKPLTKRTKDIR